MGPRPQRHIPGHWPFGSREDFCSVFTIYGRGCHLGHVTQTPQTNFCSPIPLRLHMKFGFDWCSGFREEDLWKWWTDSNGWMDEGPWLYYKLTNEPKGSGELIKWITFWLLKNSPPIPHPLQAHQAPALSYAKVVGCPAGADNPLGTNVHVNRKPLSLCPFVASLKTISLKSDFIHIFSCFPICI